MSDDGSSATTAPDGTQSQADGSPSVDQTLSGDDAATQITELRRKVTQQGEENKSQGETVEQARALVKYLQANPGATVENALTSFAQGNSAPAIDYMSKRDEILGKFDPGVREALAELDALRGDEIQATLRNTVEPRLARTDRFVQDTAFDRSIQNAGINPHGEAEQAYLGEMRGQRWFRSLEQADPSSAAEQFAERYAAQQATNGHATAQQAQINDARNHSLEASGGRSAAGKPGDPNVFLYDPAEHGMEDLFQAHEAGKSVVRKR